MFKVTVNTEMAVSDHSPLFGTITAFAWTTEKNYANLIQDNQSAGQDSNLGPPKYWKGMLII